MDTKIKSVEVTLDQEEVWELAYALLHRIENVVSTHWINFTEGYDEELFVEKVMGNIEYSYNLLNTLCNLLDRRDLIAEIEYDIRLAYKAGVQKNLERNNKPVPF